MFNLDSPYVPQDSLVTLANFAPALIRMQLDVIASHVGFTGGGNFFDDMISPFCHEQKLLFNRKFYFFVIQR